MLERWATPEKLNSGRKKNPKKTVNDQLGMDRSEGGGESKRSEHRAAAEREDGEGERERET